LNEYVTIRKSIIAWSECSDATMSPKGLRCGLGIVSNGRTIEQSDANIVFEFGISLQKKNKFRISFPVFLLISDLYRIFSGFDVPIDNGYITKNDIKRKMMEQDLPLRLTLTAAQAILDLDNTENIDFNTFASTIVFYNRWFLYSNG